jgi:hypothetical protein
MPCVDLGAGGLTMHLMILPIILGHWEQLCSLSARVARSNVTDDALFDFQILVRSDVTQSAKYHEPITSARANAQLRGR